MGIKYYYYANLPKWRLCWSSVGRVSGGTESSFHANVCATRMTMMIVGSSSSSLSVYHHQNIQQGIWRRFSIYSQFIVVAVIRVVRGKGIEKNRIGR